MDGNFELNKLGWYEVQVVEPNDFLNDKLENDTYGIWYSVKFQGDAGTHLWQAKTAPEPKQRVYGHIEMTKSGKSTKFRRAKKEDTPQEVSTPSDNTPTSGTPKQAQSTDESIARAVALKAAVESFKTTADMSNVLKVADTYLAWLQGNVQKPVETVDKEPARDWTKLSKRKDEDMDAVDTYKKYAEPMPEPPEGY